MYELGCKTYGNGCEDVLGGLPGGVVHACFSCEASVTTGGLVRRATTSSSLPPPSAGVLEARTARDEPRSSKAR